MTTTRATIVKGIYATAAGCGVGMIAGELLFVLPTLASRITQWSPLASVPFIIAVVSAAAIIAALWLLWRRHRYVGGITVALCALAGMFIIPKIGGGSAVAFNLIVIWRKFVILHGLAGALIGAAAMLWCKNKAAAVVAAICVATLETTIFAYLAADGTSRAVAMRNDYITALRRNEPPHKCDSLKYTVTAYDNNAKAPWTTPTVDGSFLGLKSSRTDMAARHIELGFDPSAIPLRGIIYRPDTAATLPIVVIAHGSHPEHNPVYEGYDYLCRALARNGYIAVSIDENFLNDRWSGVIAEVEMDARGWVMLKHLEQLRRWNNDPSHPLHDMIDFDKITLAGHSRGGRAATLAALFNNLPCYPLRPSEKFDFGFGIKSIIAIAPYDGYLFDNHLPAIPDNVDYLVLIAGHDTDVYLASGLQTYNNVHFDDDRQHIKSAIFMYGATHAGFNSLCVDDMAFPYNLFARRSDFIAPAAQRKAAETLIVNFMNATCRGDSAAMQALADYRRLGNALPDDYYLSLYRASDDITIAGFDEDLDTSTGTIAGSTTEGSDPSACSERMLVLRDSEATPQNNRALIIHNAVDTLKYTVVCTELPDSIARAADFMTLDVYNLMNKPCDFGIIITQDRQQICSTTLAKHFTIPPMLVTAPQKSRLATLPFGDDHETMGQTVRIPIALRDTATRLTIQFVFPPSTTLALDNIGLAKDF